MSDSERLDGIIRESIELENGQLADTAYGVTPTWDSVAHPDADVGHRRGLWDHARRR